ncbi:MAG: hypothetical protein HYR56_19300 [Acidobacteria bacterium]|nr:hypothetical protein [Acidobacteriota bacterium]MBI3426148.1 hypothetical protein [Acidobacteriota bacterium]
MIANYETVKAALASLVPAPVPDASLPSLLTLVKFADRLKVQIVQEELGAKPLTMALLELHQLQKLMGFVGDEFKNVRLSKAASGDGTAHFNVGIFPERGLRMAGKGKPLSFGAALPDTCGSFLCAENVLWQQGGNQVYFTRQVNGEDYNFLVNPFPFGLHHSVAASSQCQPQSPRGTLEMIAAGLGRRIADALDLAAQAREFVVLWNGEGAAASQRHLHFQQLWKCNEPYPLQAAAQRASLDKSDPAVLLIDEPYYPLTSFRLRGEGSAVIAAGVELALHWRTCVGEKATENLIVIWEADAPSLYYVPRHADAAYASGFPGQVGAFECLGNFIFANGELFDRGGVDYAFLRRLLRDVSIGRSFTAHS